MRSLLLLTVALVVMLVEVLPAAAQPRGGPGMALPRPGPYPPGPYPPGPYPPYPYYPYPYFYSFPVFNPSAINYAPRPPAPDPLPPPQEHRAVINIILPSTANDLWVDGVKMPTRETASRRFVSPPLEQGHNYTYEVRAAWPDRTGMVAQTRSVVVAANQTATVDFNLPPGR
jgi:uncharacterized protein (TIGR03000 family)